MSSSTTFPSRSTASEILAGDTGGSSTSTASAVVGGGAGPTASPTAPGSFAAGGGGKRGVEWPLLIGAIATAMVGMVMVWL